MNSNSISISKTLTPSEKKRLRRIKTQAFEEKPAGRNYLSHNCNSAPYMIQFWRDLRTYGLYEALLYMETYEDAGHFNKGTAAEVASLYLK